MSWNQKGEGFDEQYISRVKYLIDNCRFAVLDKEFHDEHGLIINNSHYLGGQLDSGFYRIDTKHGVREIHYPKFVDFLEHYKKEPTRTFKYDEAISIQDNKKVIVGFSMYPRPYMVSTFRKYFFDELFKDSDFLQKMRDGKVHIYLYYGWEPDNFNDVDAEDNDFEKVLHQTIVDYKLPWSSIIVLSSNIQGYSNYNRVSGQEKWQSKESPRIIYDNFYELHTFKSLKGEIDLDYTFDEYIENCKNTDKYCLRLNRTSLPSRDFMMYYLAKSGNIDKSIIEHSEYDRRHIHNFVDRFIHDPVMKFRAEVYPSIKNILGYEDVKTHELIESKIPMIASTMESNQEYEQHYSNETIPHDVYKKSIFSWVSTTFTDKHNMVFLNMSTFNPILYYHPLIYFGNNNTATYLRKSKFLSYEFLYEEELVDGEGDFQCRGIHSAIEVDKLFNMKQNDLINLIEENRHIMEYNKKKLIECDSVRRILINVSNIIQDKDMFLTF